MSEATAGGVARWSDELLDAARTRGDPPADTAVAAYFHRRRELVDDPGAMLRELVAHVHAPPQDADPDIAAFLAAARVAPPWLDPDRLARGQRFFGDRLVHQFIALYLASLPSAYAASRGVHVLWLTTRLQTAPERRLNETAQFLMDVSADRSFGPAGPAVDRILHVRLMHAAVRWLIEHDPSVDRPADADPSVLPDRPTWAASWGRPLNQEDTVGTLLTFTTVVYDAFRRTGLDVSTDDALAHLHLWCVIGSFLGIEPDLLPTGLADAVAGQRAIMGRQQESSAVGRAMTATLLGLVTRRASRGTKGLVGAVVHRYIGADVAAMIGVRSTRRGEVALSTMVALSRWSNRRRLVPRWVATWMGRGLVNGLLEAGRDGQRPPFAIPDELRE